MEVKDAERTVIAKPIASRPSCSHFKSFSELLAGAINASPPSSCVETTAAIRPKTVRFKPPVEKAPLQVVSSKADESGTAVCNLSVNVLKPDHELTVVYKPMAKLVSRKTASILANLGNFDISHQQALLQLQAQVQVPDQVKYDFQTQPTTNAHQKLSLQMDTNQISDPSMLQSQNMEESQRAQLMSNTDRPSYDGYNWRKYGQKQVKGSEYPRSYYKCTHPNCPVKKKVERSLDGQIAEIVYKGEHNHPKPQPPKRLSSGTQGHGQAFISDGFEPVSGNPLWSSPLSDGIERSATRTENGSYIGSSINRINPVKLLLPREPVMDNALSSGVRTPDNSCGLSGDCEEPSKGVDENDDEPSCKRRKKDNQANEVHPLGQGVQEPRIVVQSSTESEIVGDGFRWRKYGQKVVKGNPYPRSYYRCTGHKCNVRKHVERASDDPRAFITTYEGKHNHEMPVSRSLNGGASAQTHLI
ncbi:WRKY transcription factor [Cinnamomum micranthum f. kanehirae]|uniref:WRKY transcription factor n=1 Tax=Cinnamomum micranthum f. kanehirae TaxID=337451 RepID=A0A3S3QAL0_9MAGN|nr:WRKY transcription factor [Cinnamomum micranthum f. kanehirae]